MKNTDLKKQSKTDWALVDALKDEDIDYSDISELTDDFFSKALFVPAKQAVTMSCDP